MNIGEFLMDNYIYIIIIVILIVVTVIGFLADKKKNQTKKNEILNNNTNNGVISPNENITEGNRFIQNDVMYQQPNSNLNFNNSIIKYLYWSC